MTPRGVIAAMNTAGLEESEWKEKKPGDEDSYSEIR
jgi:hypothetical protein